MQKANVYVATHEAEMTPLVAAYVGIDPAVLAQMKNPERGTIYNPADLRPLINGAAKYKFISGPFPASELISDAALTSPK